MATAMLYVIISAGLKPTGAGRSKVQKSRVTARIRDTVAPDNTQSGRVSSTVRLPTRTNFGKMNAASWQTVTIPAKREGHMQMCSRQELLRRGQGERRGGRREQGGGSHRTALYTEGH